MTVTISSKGKTAALTLLIILQGIAAIFYLADAIGDTFRGAETVETAMEFFASLMLLAGLVSGILLLRNLMAQLADTNRALDVARGHLSSVVTRQFELWALTPAEREVALFALKGLDAAEIATLRSAAKGTVRAQLTRIYAKAGVSNRAQLAAFFVEDLLSGPVETLQE
ncbi:MULTISPECIES: helix-turn-helix transcriptional regulator [Cohaesibacter]|uniref:helix-turn-helix transcriptional regulator n=1 Tax=Cohaesibacter TaxID=655352 RepID=UPI001FE22D4E|nr:MULTISPECIES: helix-turn-helix transcriptional regulator [Cohaesibacter]